MSETGFSRLGPRSKTGRTDAVFLGDSITSQANWSRLFPQVKCVNLGVSGARFADLLPLLSGIERLQPRAIFLMGGVNSAGVESVAEVMGDLEKIVSQLSSNDGRLVLQTSLPPCDERAGFVHALNDRLRQFAKDHRILCLDLGALCLDGRLREDLTTDGTHLNAAGYAVWADILRPHVIAAARQAREQ